MKKTFWVIERIVPRTQYEHGRTLWHDVLSNHYIVEIVPCFNGSPYVIHQGIKYEG
jgi:hypothetical protein